MHESLRLSRHGRKTADKTTYRQIMEKVLHLTNSRPDISYATGVLSRYMQNPQLPHLKAAKHLLRYLRGTVTGSKHCEVEKCFGILNHNFFGQTLKIVEKCCLNWKEQKFMSPSIVYSNIKYQDEIFKTYHYKYYSKGNG